LRGCGHHDAAAEGQRHPGRHRLRADFGLDGSDPDIGAVKQGAYPVWTVEYLYTYGTPAPETLAAAFLAYMNTDTAKDILRSGDYTPCVDRGVSLMGTLCRG
jgi:hypothetical protein